MFDENQLAKVRWSSRNKEYFTSIGFTFTNFNDYILVPARLLKKHSTAIVNCICDYCGNAYQTEYGHYLKSAERGKVCCKECKQFKVKDAFINKYGSTSVGGSKECREKAKAIMIDRYGCEYAMQSIQGQKHFKETMVERYGYDNPVKCPELQAKAKDSMYNNGTFPTSEPERKMVEMLKELYGEENCMAGYPIDRVNLDCLLVLNNNRIDCEYDGKYWHDNMEEYDRKRNHWLISKGYKVLRIKGNIYDELPTIERLKEEIDYLIDGHSLGYIDMNN